MIRSTGTSGLILAASEPSSSIASRIAARSTIAGTPVKSCISTRAGWNGISFDGSAFASQEAIVSTLLGGDRVAVLQAQHVLEQDLERVRQARGVELVLQRVEAVDLELATADLERVLGTEAVAHRSSMATTRRRPIHARRPPTW